MNTPAGHSDICQMAYIHEWGEGTWTQQNPSNNCRGQNKYKVLHVIGFTQTPIIGDVVEAVTATVIMCEINILHTVRQ